MTRVSVHVSTGLEGTPAESNHVVVEVDGAWTATARHAFWDEKRDTSHPNWPGGIDGVVTVVRAGGAPRVFEAFLFPAGWRISAAIGEVPRTAQTVARRALRKLPTTT